MANIKITDLTNYTTPDTSDVLEIVDVVNDASKKITVGNIATAVSTELTLGTAAQADTGDFATAAQGGLADTAVQPGDLGTAAAADTGDFEPANANIQSHINSTSNPHTVTYAQVGCDYFHGIEAHGALTFDDTSHVLTMASGTNTYWFQSTKYTTSSAITCDLDSYITLTANTLYYVYFDDASGTKKANSSGWSLKTKVPVATVFWNGTTAAVCEETHNHTRDLDWHTNAHMTIGARISPSDFAMTAPSVASPSTVDFAGGTLWDEDHSMVHGQQTNCRVWYQVGASTYTFVNSNSVYPTNVRFVDSANSYTLTDVSAAQYINMWLYTAPDTQRGIYCFVETKATSGYTTVALARAVNPPSLSGFGLTAELKLLYRIILKGDETFVEATDYRASAPLPGGGLTAPTAAGVTVTPSGAITSTNVQAALEELDSEATAHLTASNPVIAAFNKANYSGF